MRTALLNDADGDIAAASDGVAANKQRWSTLHSREPHKNTAAASSDDADAPTAETEKVYNKLTTFQGVYLPCMMSIFNVLMYLRFTWMVGNAGLIQTYAIMGMSTVFSISTIVSMSAICSNGAIKGGGVYFMLSRTMGPEMGGSIGMLFYIAGTISGNLSILGMLDPVMKRYPQLESESGWLRALSW
jgi:hypothetical protein